MAGINFTDERESQRKLTFKNNNVIHSTIKSFTADQIIKELENSETLDDAIMFFKGKM